MLNAVPRAGLNRLLVEAAASEPGVELFFGKRCIEVARDAEAVTFVDVETGRRRTVVGDLIVGADGVHSTVRAAIQRGTFADFSKQYVDWRYK